MSYRVRVCSFDALDLPKRPSYEQLKSEALRVGRFSAFEATASTHIARLFDRLESDPDVVIDRESSSFPWLIVRLRATENPNEREIA